MAWEELADITVLVLTAFWLTEWIRPGIAYYPAAVLEPDNLATLFVKEDPVD